MNFFVIDLNRPISINTNIKRAYIVQTSDRIDLNFDRTVRDLKNPRCEVTEKMQTQQTTNGDLDGLHQTVKESCIPLFTFTWSFSFHLYLVAVAVRLASASTEIRVPQCSFFVSCFSGSWVLWSFCKDKGLWWHKSMVWCLVPMKVIWSVPLWWMK